MEFKKGLSDSPEPKQQWSKGRKQRCDPREGSMLCVFLYINRFPPGVHLYLIIVLTISSGATLSLTVISLYGRLSATSCLLLV